MFLSKSDEETTGNRKLAKELVDKWVSLCYQTHYVLCPCLLSKGSLLVCHLIIVNKKQSRPIFNKSTRFEDMRRYDDERAPYRRPQMKK